MNKQVSTTGASAPKLNPAAIEQARGFLSTLFLGLRIAQTHQLSSRTFENASRIVLQASSQLFNTTGPFSVQFAESGALLNGQRLHFDAASEQALASLKSLLGSAGMTALEMRNTPTEASTRKLMLLFAAPNTPKPARSDPTPTALDSQARAIRTYAKLILAARGEPVRVQAVLQELVEIVAERPDHLLRLSLNDRGGAPAELSAAGAALVALVLGRALGLGREDLVQLAWAALLHQKPIAELAKETVGRCAELRIAVLGERDQPNAHLFARIAAVAVRYQERVSAGASPHDAAVELLGSDDGVDPKLVDLLLNVLRVFPIGAEVVLQSDEQGVVSELGERWDRPAVRIDENTGTTTLDLRADAELNIAGTKTYVGSGGRITLDEVQVEAPEIFDLSQLESIGSAQIEITSASGEPVTELHPGPDLAQLSAEPTAEPAPEPTPEPELVEENAISEIDELKGRLEQRRRRDAERDRARRSSQIEHLSAQIAGYRAERAELAEEAEALEEDANGAVRLAETVVVRQGEVDRTLAEMTPEIAELEGSLEGLWSERQELGDRATSLEHRALAARADARDAEDKAAEADSEAQQRADRIAELEVELEQLRTERDDLDRAADTFRNAAVEEKRIAAEADSAAETIRREAQAYVPDLTAKEERLDDLRDRRLKLEAEKLSLEQSAANAKSIAGEARVRVDEARARIAQADAALEELEIGLEELRIES